MPLLRSATRPQAVECFFCLSPSVLPPQLPQAQYAGDRKGKGRAVNEVGTKWNWECPRCHCWNMRDERGEMRSDHPAMHDPAFNVRSFALRASPSTSHLPSASRNAAKLFCHSCLTNQTLIMNMLANYLPDDQDPSYSELYANLPSYLSSLHGRYPPVCPQCQPAVDQALRKADQKAQVEAWGSALRRGQHAGSSDGGGGGGAGVWEVLVWRMRGVGFWVSAVVSLSVDVACSFTPRRALSLFDMDKRVGLGLLGFYFASILWFAWDPHWLRRRRDRYLGRVRGRGTWLRCMSTILLLRLVSASLLSSNRLRNFVPFGWLMRAFLTIEVVAFIIAFAALKNPRPVALRLIRPTQLSVPTSPIYPASAGTQPSNAPPYINHQQTPYSTLPEPTHHPVFGKASLLARPSSRLQNNDMDWEATPPPALYNGGYTSSGPMRSHDDEIDDVGGYDKGGGQWDNFAVGRQRLFGQKEGEDETGLEGLLAGWGLADQVGGHGGGSGGQQGRWGNGALRWFKGTKGKEQ